jgi:hypothetical protein
MIRRMRIRLARLWYRARLAQLRRRGWENAPCAAHRVADSDTRAVFGPRYW